MRFLKKLSPGVMLALIMAIVSVTLAVTALSATVESNSDIDQNQAIAQQADASALASQTAIFENCIANNSLRRKVYGYFQGQIEETQHPNPFVKKLVKQFDLPKKLLDKANQKAVEKLREVRDKFQPVQCKQKYSDFDPEVLNANSNNKKVSGRNN